MVAFRGLFANRYTIPGLSDAVLVLCPGDTVVHPDHRRQGLSSAMIHRALVLYQDQARILLNMSANSMALGGYLKSGFVPLTQRVCWSQSTLLGILRHSLAADEYRTLEQARVAYGRYGAIAVSPEPRAEEMAAIVARQGPAPGKLQLLRDKRFYRWRFSSGRKKYVFYHLMDGEAATAFVVLGLSRNNQRAYILDYAQSQPGGAEQILSWVIRARHFPILSIYRFGADPGLQPALARMHFGERNLVRFLERSMHGERPVLIRPVRPQYADSDFWVGGLDLRQVGNWMLLPIASDGE